MVTRYGFSVLGPVALEQEGGEVFLGRDWTRSEHHYSASTAKVIDQEVQQMARAALDRAVAMLQPRRELIDDLVESLIEQETLDGDSFRAQVASFENRPGGLSAELNVEAAQVAVQSGILNRE
jgi:cell division protease FtsH